VELRTRGAATNSTGALWSNNNSAFNAAPYFQNLQGQPTITATETVRRTHRRSHQEEQAVLLFRDRRTALYRKVEDVGRCLRLRPDRAFSLPDTGSRAAQPFERHAFSARLPSILNGNILTSANRDTLYSISQPAHGRGPTSARSTLCGSAPVPGKYMRCPTTTRLRRSEHRGLRMAADLPRPGRIHGTEPEQRPQ